MRKAVHFVKQMVATGLYLSGALSLIARTRLRHRMPVLMYHRVIDDQHVYDVHSSSGIIVSKDVFRMQMATIRQWLNPIGIDEFVECLRSGRGIPQRSCLVTFDDGWVDNYDIALPIIREFTIPAVVFLPTNYISADKMFWQEELLVSMSDAIASADEERLAMVSEILNSGSQSYELTMDGVRTYISDLKTGHDSDIDEMLGRIRKITPAESELQHYNRYLTWSQVKEMQEQGLSFGSHAVSHRALDKLSERDCRNELRTSRRIIEEKIALPVLSLAYPNGNYNADVVREARDAGYEVAFTTEPGFFDRNADPLRVPRMNIHDINSSTKSRFLCATLGLF